MARIKRALLSVSNKEGIVDFARELENLGIEIISTGGTYRLLAEAGVRVIPINEVTGFPEMMDGRVKTLHPRIHAGILALRDKGEHLAELREQGIETIDLVVCNLYPFAETIAREGVTLAEAVENIDIGGPTMIRAAAKNFKDVAVVVSPADYADIIKELKDNDSTLSEELTLKLAYKAFRHTAEYDYLIQDYLNKLVHKTEEGDFPEILLDKYQKKFDLRYGENPHQKAVFYQELEESEPSVTSARQLYGKELSFNNINDSNGALELVKEFTDIPAVAIIKHANPCGMATGSSLLEAYRKAYEGDSLSAYGGIIALNEPVTEEVAREIAGENRFFEVIIAPAYSEEALEILKNRWKNIRILETGALFINRDKPGYDMKKVVGGLLVQERDLYVLKKEDLQTVTRVKPTEEQLKDLLFAWKVVKHVKSNAIVMAKDGMITGVGAGQMSRVDSMIIAGEKSAGRQEGGVVASDAFFPFPDAIEEAARKGIKAIIQPGGSIRDAEVIEMADKYGIAMVFTGVRHFKH